MPHLNIKFIDKGFTLIELLVTVGIFMVLVGVGVASYSQFNEKSKSRQAALNLKNNLRYAQSKAISSVKSTGSLCRLLVGFQVTFSSNQVYSVQEKCNNNFETDTDTEDAGETINHFSVSLASQNLNFSSPYPDYIFFKSKDNTVVISPSTSTTITVANPALSTYFQRITISNSGDINGPN